MLGLYRNPELKQDQTGYKIEYIIEGNVWHMWLSEPTRAPSNSWLMRYLAGVEAITKILEKLSDRDQNNAKLLRSLERADASTPDRSTSPCSTSEAKRKRAKERQAKLLQQFASKQRIFEAQMEAENLVPFTVSLIVIWTQ